MKPIERRTGAARGRGPVNRVLGLATLILCALLATVAQASTELLADTTLVSGSQSAVFSFNISGPGTVSVQLTNLDWPQALSSLSFMAGTASQVLSSWSGPGSAQSLSFQVATGGSYFADVMAAAGGPLDLGAYSLSIAFTPAAPVPLPPSGALLLVGALGIFGVLAWAHAGRGALAAPVAAPAAS